MNTLKFFSITLLFLCCFSFVQSCDKGAAVEERLEMQKNQMESYAEIAVRYNVEKGSGLNSINRAFTSDGRITSELRTEQVDKETISHIEIVYEPSHGKSPDQKLWFDVGYPNNILEGMTDVSVAFFNDVLIFVDLESGREVTFEVPKEGETVSELQLGKGKTEVDYIGISLEDKEVLRARGCVCDCIKKPTAITASCSCNSPCSGCSVSCRSGGEAVCANLCPLQ